MSCTTHIFAKFGSLDLEVDVHTPHEAQNGGSMRAAPVPVLFMLHGGGFMCGDKSSHPPVVMDFLQSQGFCIVSPNYPLVPCATIGDQIEAVQEAWKWVHSDAGLVTAIPHCSIDCSRAAVWGGSAAATLLLLAELQPRPKAMVLLYPFVDLHEPSRMGSLVDLGANKAPYMALSEARRQTRRNGLLQATPFDDFLRLMTATQIVPAAELHSSTVYLFTVARDAETFCKTVIGDEAPGSSSADSLRTFDVTQHLYLSSGPPAIVLQGLNDSVTPAANTRDFIFAYRRRSDSQIELVETNVNGGKHCFDFAFESAQDPGFARTIGSAADFLWQILKRRTEVNGCGPSEDA